MKNKTSFTIDILLCITLISSLFYCLVTSFDIKTEWYIIVVPTAIFCTIYGLLASLVKKSGVLFISVAITMIVFVFTLLFSLESILEQLSYVITQVLKPLSQYLPVQNKIILGDTLGTSATGLFVFISAILSAVFTISLIRYKRILIPSLLSMVLLVPCFILVNTLPSLVCLFIAIASLIALYISKNTRKFRPSQGGVIAAISFGTMLVVMAILLAFNPIEKYERFDWQENLLQVRSEQRLQSVLTLSIQAVLKCALSLTSRCLREMKKQIKLSSHTILSQCRRAVLTAFLTRIPKRFLLISTISFATV